MKKILQLLLAIGLFCVTLPSFAITEKAMVEDDVKNNTPKVYDLNTCVQTALENSPNIRKYRGYLKAAKTRVSQAKSDFFPTLTAGTGYGYNGMSGNKIKSTSDGTYSASASLNWLIFNFGKTNAKIDMQKFYAISSQNDLDNIILQTIYKVRTNYYGVLAAKAYVDVQNEYVKLNERQYQRTKAYFEEGLKSKIDLVNSEVYLSEAKISLIDAKNTYDSAIISLNNSMYLLDSPDYSIKSTETFNFKSGNTIPVTLKDVAKDENYSVPKSVSNAVLTSSVEKADILQNYTFKPFPYNFEDSVKYAKEHRPDLKALYATEKAIQKALVYAKRDYYPSITAKAGYDFKDTSKSAYTNGLNAGAYLNFPVINGANTKFQIDEAKANLDVARDSVDMAEKDLYFEVQKAYINMKKLEKQVPLQQVKVRQTLENFELADGRYEVGLADFIELQDAKVNYNNAQREYVKIIFDYNVARAKLELAIAMLPEEIQQTEGNTKK